MISVHQARCLIQEQINALPVQRVSLRAAAGHILGNDVYAFTDIPAFEQSSMDGYAIRFEDHDRELLISGEMQAGSANQYTLLPGQAARIFTGAPLPVHADTVVMQEKVQVEAGRLTILDSQLIKGSNVRNRGSEIKSGALAISGGCRLTPAAIGFLAGIGKTEIDVYQRPSVGIIITGNELQQPGKELIFGQVYESNSYSLTAALQQMQIGEISYYHADDKLDELTAVLQGALRQHEVILLTGGVSVGDYDFVLRAAEQAGITQVFHRVKQKPGKPLYFGQKGNQVIFGLPGNPSSVLSCFYQYVLPALLRLCGHRGGLLSQEAILTHGYSKNAGLTHFLKAHFENGNVTPLNAQESFRMSSFAQANCMIELPEEETTFEVGRKVIVHLFSE